ncbi:hypothetical protein Q6315_28695, partial [Klebsiella pneumoniae]|uniref:hypothetical protein n=1 Tax=Klebsiella pneumoniae TaxID=573 RepID=UPI00272F134C
LLGLPNGVWTPLDRQIVRRLRRGPWLFCVLWPALPLPAVMRLLLGAVEMLVLRTRLRVLDARRLLLTRLIVFRAWLVVLRP